MGINEKFLPRVKPFDLDDFTPRELVAEALRVAQIIKAEDRDLWLDSFESRDECGSAFCLCGWLYVINGGGQILVDPDRKGIYTDRFGQFLERIQTDQFFIDYDEDGLEITVFGELFDIEFVSGSLDDRIKRAQKLLKDMPDDE